MWHMHAPTFNKWHKNKNKNKMVTLHILTHDAMRRCGLTSLMVCINDNFCNIRERNVTIRSEIWTTNIKSLGFWNIREWVTLRALILQSLGCITLLSWCCGPSFGIDRGRPQLPAAIRDGHSEAYLRSPPFAPSLSSLSWAGSHWSSSNPLAKLRILHASKSRPRAPKLHTTASKGQYIPPIDHCTLYTLHK